jgi:hypothetical protein
MTAADAPAAAAAAGAVTPETKLNELLARHPSIAPILVQMGRGWVNRKGDLYAQYPDLTVKGYAELNGLDADALTRRLAAAVEAEEMARKVASRPPGEDSPAMQRPPVTIGYTGTYVDREGIPPGSVPVVLVQSQHGPE